MPRHTYQLQVETIKVLSDHKSCIAEKLDVSERYIRAVLAGTETDAFAKFLEIYRAAVRSGAPVHHWDDRLAEERELNRVDLCLKTEAKAFTKESADVSIAALDGDPHTVLREAREAIASGKRLDSAALSRIQALRNEMAASVGKFRSERVRQVSIATNPNGGRT